MANHLGMRSVLRPIVHVDIMKTPAIFMAKMFKAT
jgi:hypothetical protein